MDHGFERMDYTNAIKLLEASKQKFEYPVKWGPDLQSEHERFLGYLTGVGNVRNLIPFPRTPGNVPF